MKRSTGLITRRGALVAGGGGVGGVILARRFPKILPPTCGNVLRAGDTFTYGMQKALLSDRALAKEYRPEDLTSFPATGTTDPGATEEGGVRRSLPPPAGWRVRGLATAGRRPRREAAGVLAGRAEAVPAADPDHAAHVRGRVERHRPVDGRSALAPCSTRRASWRPRASCVFTRTTTGSTASTCSTPCTRRRSWPTG